MMRFYEGDHRLNGRAPAPVLVLPNQRWSLDFVHDHMASGCRFRVLNIVDDVTRECLRAVPDTSISGRRVVREFTELIAERGEPRDDRQRQRHRADLERGPRLVRGDRR